MSRNSHLHRKPVAFLAGAIISLPVVLVAGVLWQAFATQVDDSYEKQLTANLSLFELAVDKGLDDFRRALSSLTADNTIQVTVDLDIRPQLKRYLNSQFDVSNFEFVTVSNASGQTLAAVGNVDGAGLACRQDVSESVEQVTSNASRLLIARTLPLSYKGRRLGHLCGGYALNGRTVVEKILSRIDGLAALSWRDRQFPIKGSIPDLGPQAAAGEVFTAGAGGNNYRGMRHVVKVANEDVYLDILVDVNRYEAARIRSGLVILFVVTAVLLVSGFGIKMLGLRRRAEDELMLEREKAVVTLASIADGVITTDPAGHITYINSAAEQLLDMEEAGLLGSHLYEAFELRNESSGERAFDLKRIDEGNPSIGDVDFVLISRSGIRTHVHFSLAPIAHDSVHSGYVITLRDVHRERELRSRLAWKASRDDLTGLLNRTEFRRSLGTTIAETRDPSMHHCLLYIDLDEFKVVNDTCGHKAGDELLRQVSGGLLSLLRGTDIVARLGGDEFGVLLRNCSRERGIRLAETIIELINDKRFTHLDKVFHVGASIGLVSVTQATENLEDLLSTVDAACYAAKERGRNRVFVGEVDAAKILHRMDELSQASHIRQALKEDRFVLYRQSIVNVQSPSPQHEVHAEVLVRMIGQDGNLVVPGAFIPAAERYGLMQDIDRWIIRRLFEIEGDSLRRWRAGNADGEDRTDFVYSINLSGASLTDSTFLAFVKDELLRHAIPGGAVAFEITETQIITHLDRAVEFISALKELGCKFLLDDFGSGMSSFGYLKHLPVDYLKIDGLFVKDILSDPIDKSMVKAINEIGHTMRLKTIAEYVENDEILREISEIGVDMAQGYGIAKPEPISQWRRASEAAGA